MLLLVSCKTLKPELAIPEIDFPHFPISATDPNIRFSAEGDNIKIEWIREGVYAVIPIDKWEDLVEYAVDVDTAKKKYQALQKTKNAIQK